MISSIIIQFDRQPHEFEPLEVISGTFRPVDAALDSINRIEFSVLWFTEGKGDEDLGVHFFKTLSGETGMQHKETEQGNYVIPVETEDEDSQTFRFAVRLPASPLSYYGKILKIHWCARVRLFLKNGREVNSERMFNVGKISPVQIELN